jgi:hypothetical protein
MIVIVVAVVAVMAPVVAETQINNSVCIPIN